MRAMAYKLFSYLASHPLFTAVSFLLLFILPIFDMLVFFWPLIASTVLGVLAVVSFGRQSAADEHSTPIAGGYGSAESPSQPDIMAFSSYEEKISNVLLVGNQEVTWLEWLHNEDTGKICARECEPAVWDAYGCDGSTMASEASVVDPVSRDSMDASNGCTYKDEAIGDVSLQEGKLYAGGSGGEGNTHVSALVLTEENETAVLSRASDGFRGTATVLAVVNKEETKIDAPILRAADEKHLDSTGEGHMCRSGRTMQRSIALTGNGESNTLAPTCAEGDKGQMSVEGLCLTVGGGNECKAMQGSLDSATHTKNEVNGYASADGKEVAGVVESMNESNIIVHSLESTIDIASTLNKCVLEGESGLLVAVSTLEGSTEAISHTSEPKIAHAHEQDAPDSAFSDKIISPLLETKGAEVHGMRHVNEQHEAKRGSNQFETQGPQWDVSDGEEDRSSLCFSFFHSSSFTPSES